MQVIFRITRLEFYENIMFQDAEHCQSKANINVSTNVSTKKMA